MACRITDPLLLYRNKYRSPTARKQGWDYAHPGSYFITICTKNRVPWFGHIEYGSMILTELGVIASECFYEIPHHYSHVKIDAFVVMPDHMHGIVVIGERMMTTVHHATTGYGDYGVGTPYMASLRGSHTPPTSDSHTTSIRKITTNAIRATVTANPHHHPEWQSACLGSIIQQYKRACSFHIRETGYHDFAWQPRFYDRIIPDERALNAIRTYIIENPQRHHAKRDHAYDRIA